MALADLKPRPGWLGPCLPMEAPLCRTQQTIKYEPAPINCGSKPESPKVGRMSSGTGRERIAGGEAAGSRQRTSANYTARIALKLVDLRKHLTLKKERCHSLTRFLHLAFLALGEFVHWKSWGTASFNRGCAMTACCSISLQINGRS